MAETKEVKKAKLIIGIMYADEEIYEQVIRILKKKFGDLEQGPTINFDFTNYYDEEMGKSLKKTYIASKTMIKKEELPSIKLFTNKLETEFLQNGNRKINIDPGYLTEQQVVLASAKQSPYRIYLAEGIYGQIVFVYTKQGWITIEKTFADYKTKEVQEFLLKLRANLYK